MTAATFDALQFAKELKAAKFPEKQAETIAAGIRDAQKETLTEVARAAKEASDQTMKDLDSKTEKALRTLEHNLLTLEHKVDSLELGLRKDMEALGNKLVIRLTVVMAALLGFAFAAYRYLPPPAH